MPARRTQSDFYLKVHTALPFDLLGACDLQQRFVAHAHEEYAIGLVSGGSGRLEHALGTDDHSEGSIIAIPPNLVHAGAPAGSGRFGYRMMYLPAAYLEQAARDAGWSGDVKPWFPRCAVTDPEIARRLERCLSRLELSDENPTPAADELATVLRDLIARHAVRLTSDGTALSTASSEIRAVRAEIERTYTKPLRIDDLARLSGLSPFYLIRAFRRAYGIPPYMFVQHLRVQHARRLIEQGESIVNAALECGFADQSHLTRRFKRTLGITPGMVAGRRTRP